MEEDLHQETKLMASSPVFYIKLNIQKGQCSSEKDGGCDDEGEDGAEYLAATKLTSQVCMFCKKRFSSGKALGGHMRIHVQSTKEPLRKKIHGRKFKRSGSNTNSQRSTATMAQGQDDHRTCVICGKSFPSVKSLYGHMRSHPDREWRGVHPPPATAAKQSSSSSTVSDSVAVWKADDDQIVSDDDAKERSSSVVDLSRSLPRWGVTAKRGKTAGTPSVTGSSSGSGLGSGSGSGNGVGLVAQVQEAPVMLAKGNTPSKVSPMIRLRTEATADDKDEHKMDENCKANCLVGSYSGIEARNCSEIAEYKEPEAFPETELKPKEPVSMITDCVEEKQVQCSYYELDRKLKKRKRIKRFRDLEEVHANYDIQDKIIDPATPGRFKCSICNKSFPSHQALGGHKSSHSKPNKNSQTIKRDRESVWPDFTTVRGSSRLNADLSTPSSQAANTPSAASKTSCKVLDFDLNELPRMEDDKEGVVGLGADSGPSVV